MKALASAAIAYYGVMTVAYLVREAKGNSALRSVAGAVTAYYALMGIISLQQKASPNSSSAPALAP